MCNDMRSCKIFIYVDQFHDNSYGFRPNKCAQQAILTALDMMNDGDSWILDIDLEKFFDTVKHHKRKIVFSWLKVKYLQNG